MSYYKRLYDLRTDHDLKQEDVGKILDTTKQTYGRYENGKSRISVDDIIKLAKFYNVSTDYILGLSDNPKTEWNIKNQLNINGGNIGNITMK